jgi:hypothetical protein
MLYGALPYYTHLCRAVIGLPEDLDQRRAGSLPECVQLCADDSRCQEVTFDLRPPRGGCNASALDPAAADNCYLKGSYKSLRETCESPAESAGGAAGGGAATGGAAAGGAAATQWQWSG